MHLQVELAVLGYYCLLCPAIKQVLIFAKQEFLYLLQLMLKVNSADKVRATG
jgi:hypothetical protein